MVSVQNMKRVLLLAGDAKRRAPSNDPLFGFAGTATAIEFEEGNKGLQFHFGTDGSGYDAIIMCLMVAHETRLPLSLLSRKKWMAIC